MNIVVRCGCAGASTYTDKSIKVLKLPAPENTYVGKDKIRALANSYQGTPFAQHLEAIAKKSGRYSFYISTNEANEITDMYNLISGKKVY